MLSPINTISLVDDIVYGDMPFELKMIMLVTIEPIIAREYALGNTAVKPTNLITVDDLLSL